MFRIRSNSVSVPLVTIFLINIAVCLGDAVPVLIWAKEAAHLKNVDSNPFHKLTSNEFEEILTKKILGTSTWPILVFSRDTLCIEDMRKVKSLYDASSFGFMQYFASVESPEPILKSLKSYNATEEDTVELMMDHQLVTVDSPDLSSVSEKYKSVLNSNGNLIGILTGKSCKYLGEEKERIKRETTDDKETAAETKVVAYDLGRGVLLYASNILMKKGNEELKTIGKATSGEAVPGNNKTTETIFKVRFESVKPQLQLFFHFTAKTDGYWYLNKIGKASIMNVEEFGFETSIYFPFNFSYHCTDSLYFTSNDSALKMLDFQVELGAYNRTVFNDSYDCVGFTTIPIWTGLLITMIIAFMIMYGFLMIMDIRTMDRFDDPKGKTVTITNTE